MRLLIYGINFHPELTGIGKYSGELATYLNDRGHSIRVVTAPPYYPQWKIHKGYSGLKYQKQNWNGIELYRCPIWIPNEQTGFKRILHLTSFALSSAPIVLAQISWRPDFVITIIPTFVQVPVAWITSKVAGSTSWLHIQDFELDAAVNLGIISGGAFRAKMDPQAGS